MSGTMPSTPVPNAVEVTSISPTLVSVSHSLKRSVRRRGGGVQRWSIKLGFPAMARATAAPLEAFVMSQAGQYETFSYTPPYTLMEALGTYSGTVTVNGAHTAGDTTIAVSGSSGTLMAGSWVQFADHTKVYKVVADSTSSITIFPALVEDVANTTAVEYDAPTFNVALTEDNFSFTFTGAPAYYNFQLNLVEIY